VVIAGANVPDFKLLEATLEAIVVARPEPTEEAPQHLCLEIRATINSRLGKWWSATTIPGAYPTHWGREEEPEREQALSS